MIRARVDACMLLPALAALLRVAVALEEDADDQQDESGEHAAKDFYGDLETVAEGFGLVGHAIDCLGFGRISTVHAIVAVGVFPVDEVMRNGAFRHIAFEALLGNVRSG